MDKIINDQIWYNVSIQYNMLYSSINMHANIIHLAIIHIFKRLYVMREL
jgi:hypothetical protein